MENDNDENQKMEKLVSKKILNDIINDFVLKVNKTANPENFREFILHVHLICEFFIINIISSLPSASLEKFSTNPKDYNFLIRLNFFTKIDLLNILSDDFELKETVKDLRELNENRNDIAHDLFIKKLRVRGKELQINEENMEMMKKHYIDLVKKLYKWLIDVSGLENS